MSVPSGPFQYPIHLIGGQHGGTPFATCKWVQGSQALIVKGLDVWYNSSCLRGIQVTYSDQSRTPIYGTSADSHTSIVFAPGELVTSMSLWGNGVGTRTGRIRLTTNGGQTLDVGKNTSGQDTFDINVGSGILVGMMGRGANDIDQLGAVFLRSAVAHVEINNVVYSPDLAGTDKGIRDVALDEGDYSNPPEAVDPMPWTFGGSTSRTESTSYTQTTSNTYGLSASVEVSAEPFGIGVKATGGFEWKRESSVTTSTTTETTTTLSWGLQGTLQPGESCSCTALVQRGEGRTNYTARVTIKLKDGTTNTFTESGVFQNVAYTRVRVVRHPTKKSQVPKPIEISKGFPLSEEVDEEV